MTLQISRTARQNRHRSDQFEGSRVIALLQCAPLDTPTTISSLGLHIDHINPPKTTYNRPTTAQQISCLDALLSGPFWPVSLSQAPQVCMVAVDIPMALQIAGLSHACIHPHRLACVLSSCPLFGRSHTLAGMCQAAVPTQPGRSCPPDS